MEGRGFESSLRGADGELYSVRIGGNFALQDDQSRFPKCTIERSPQLIEELPQLQRKRSIEGLGEFGADNPSPTRLPIVLEIKLEGWVVSLDEGISFFSEGLSMHECPIDSVPTAIKTGHAES